jgi:hypothetical protein
VPATAACVWRLVHTSCPRWLAVIRIIRCQRVETLDSHYLSSTLLRFSPNRVVIHVRQWFGGRLDLLVSILCTTELQCFVRCQRALCLGCHHLSCTLSMFGHHMIVIHVRQWSGGRWNLLVSMSPVSRLAHARYASRIYSTCFPGHLHTSPAHDVSYNTGHLRHLYRL